MIPTTRTVPRNYMTAPPEKESALKIITIYTLQHIAGGMVGGFLFLLISHWVIVVAVVVMAVWPRMKIYSLGALIAYSAWMGEMAWLPLLAISVLIVFQEARNGRK